MRYLRPAALAAASFVLLLAAGGPGASADETAPVVAAVPRIRATVLPDRVGPPAARARDLFTGAAFDACTAPPLETMRAWRDSSPYGAVGIYTSGSQRGCAQPRLGADWVRQARAMGWRFLPVHVGLQAPCSELSRKPKRIDPARAVQQGREEAVEAVRGLKAVGLGKGSPVFLDIEAYPLRDPACGQAVVDFTLGWTQALHLAGYGSGFYSSLDSGIADLAAAARAAARRCPTPSGTPAGTTGPTRRAAGRSRRTSGPCASASTSTAAMSRRPTAGRRSPSTGTRSMPHWPAEAASLPQGEPQEAQAAAVATGLRDVPGTGPARAQAHPRLRPHALRAARARHPEPGRRRPRPSFVTPVTHAPSIPPVPAAVIGATVPEC